MNATDNEGKINWKKFVCTKLIWIIVIVLLGSTPLHIAASKGEQKKTVIEISIYFYPLKYLTNWAIWVTLLSRLNQTYINKKLWALRYQTFFTPIFGAAVGILSLPMVHHYRNPNPSHAYQNKTFSTYLYKRVFYTQSALRVMK